MSATPSDGTAGEEEPAARELLQRWDVLLVRAPNPSPLTLTGTNSWVVGRDPAWVVDPGPATHSHLQALTGAVAARGGLGGIALTHGHHDHSEAVPALRERHPAPLAAGGGEPDVALREGETVGPFVALATPGHAEDHFALLLDGEVCFTGDAVLGSGSVFISPHPGAMSGYLSALHGLLELPGLAAICPGHGPAVLDPQAKLREYIDHRLDRERRLLAAIEQGGRSTDELLDSAWSDAPPMLRPAAAATLAAHLDKLEEEGRLPDGVERPEMDFSRWHV